MRGFEDIEKRLDNWAVANKEPRPQSVSSTYVACITGNLYRGSWKNWKNYDNAPLRADYADADIVDRAIHMLDPKSKDLIITLWIRCPSMSLGRLAKKRHVRRQQIEDIYRWALNSLRSNLGAIWAVSERFSNQEKNKSCKAS